MKKTSSIEKQLKLLVISAVCFILAIPFKGCERITHSNRSLIYIQHPVTNQVLTLLVISGISDDHTYVIQGNRKSLVIPSEEPYVSFKDSFGIAHSDSTWIIYHLGEIVESHQVETLNINLIHLSKIEYRALLDHRETEFLYRYVF